MKIIYNNIIPFKGFLAMPIATFPLNVKRMTMRET